jgi:hypothetical protein
MFGSIEAEVIKATDIQLVVIVPEDAMTSTINVKYSGKEATSTTFKVQKMPLILSATEAASIGGDIIIDAKYVGPALTDNVIKVNGVNAEVTKVTAYTSSGDPEQRYQITATVPVAESGEVTLTYDGLTALALKKLPIEPYPTAFTPKGGVAGTVVTITGLNFKEDIAQNIVSVGGKAATVVSATKTQLEVNVGGSPSEFGLVIVNNVIAPGFFVGSAIPSLSPSSGSVGTWVTLYSIRPGPAGIVVKFNGVTATELDLTDGVKARVPAGATTGPVTLELNGFTSVSKINFTVL